MSANKSISRPFISRYSLILGIIFSLVAFLMLLETNRLYVAETKVMVIPRSEVISNHLSELLGNAAAISQTSEFVSQVAGVSAAVDRKISGLSSEEIKKIWKREVQVKRIGTSSMLAIVVQNESRNQASAISKSVSRALIDNLSGYYNIKDEIDIRIVEGPIAEREPKGWWSILAISLLIGSVGVGLVNGIDLIFAKVIEAVRATEFSWRFRNAKDSDDQATPLIGRIKEQLKDLARTQENMGKAVKAHPAPANLPTGNELEKKIELVEDMTPTEQFEIAETLYNNKLSEIHPMKPVSLEMAEEKKAKEDTKSVGSGIESFDNLNEEYKARLNRLMRGELD